MRTHGLTLTALLLLAPLAVAQMPPTGGTPIIPVPGANGGQPAKPLNIAGGELQPVLNAAEPAGPPPAELGKRMKASSRSG